MADQEVNFRLKATNDASKELLKVADEMRKLNHEAVISRAGVTNWGNAWGTASSTVASGATSAAEGIGSLDNAAKNAAQGGLRALTSEIPIVDGALGKLTNNLKGMPLVMLGVVGAGVGLISMLSEMSAEATKANVEIATLSKSIESDLAQSIFKIAQIRAGGAGDEVGAARIGAGAEIRAIEDARKAAAEKAKAALDETFDPRGHSLSPVVYERLLAERLTAEGKYAAESGKIEATASLKKREIAEQLKVDLGTIEDERLDKEKKSRAEAVKDSAEAAKKIADDTKAAQTSALAIFKDLGADFADVAKKLEVAEFVTKSKEAIADLGKAFALGVIDQAKLDAGTAALTTRMQEAIALGYLPTVEAAKKVSDAVTVVAEVSKVAGDSIASSLFRAGAASEQTIAILDAVIKKGQEAAAAMAASGRAGPVPIGFAGGAGGAGSAVRPEAGAAGGGGPSGVYGGPFGGSVLGGIVNQPKGSGLTPLIGGESRYGYDARLDAIRAAWYRRARHHVRARRRRGSATDDRVAVARCPGRGRHV